MELNGIEWKKISKEGFVDNKELLLSFQKPDGPSFICTVCYRSFKSSSGCNRHIIHHHYVEILERKEDVYNEFNKKKGLKPKNLEIYFNYGNDKIFSV